MSHFYESITQLFYQLSLLFFWPVAVALLLLFAVVLLDLGAVIVELVMRRRQASLNLPAVARCLLTEFDRASVDQRLEAVSPGVRRFWARVRDRLDEAQSREHIDLWLEECLQQEEIDATAKLDRSRAFIRIGPMLGLCGTIIPLGPALQSLMGGDMGGMVNHLVVGFGAVVVGLVLSGIAYFITLVRERWTRVELKEMENLCELVLRSLQHENVRERGSYESVSEA